MSACVWEIMSFDVAQQDGKKVMSFAAKIHATLDRRIEYTRTPAAVSKPAPCG